MPTTTIYRASLDTRNFSFDAYGNSAAEACSALAKGLRAHARQCEISPDFASAVAAEVREIVLGMAYRDREIIPV